jgi:hypothetical protein
MGSSALVRLSLYEWGIELSGRFRLIRSVVPTQQLLLAEITVVDEVELTVAGFVKSRGVRFHSSTELPPIVFWPENARVVLRALEPLGVPISPTVGRVSATSNR